MQKLTLLVDDDPVVNFVHQRMLQKHCPFGEIKVTEDGKQALNFLSKHHPNYDKILMLLDINMPVMDGWQLLDELSRDLNWQDKLIVFMLSSSIAQHDIDKAEEYSLVEGYITKPFNQDSCLHFHRHPELSNLLDV